MAVSKPLPGTPIDPASPWARGLVVALPFSEGGGQRLQNSAPNFQHITGAGTALQYVSSPDGGAVRTVAASSARAFFPPNPAMVGSGKVSVFLRFRLNATASSSTHLYSDGYIATTAPGGCFLILNAGVGAAGSLLWTTNGDTAAGGTTTRNFNSSLNTWFDVWADYDGASTWTLQVNGVSDFSLFTTGARGAAVLGSDLACFNNNGTRSRFASADFSALYRWEGRTFTAAEKAALRANPWQLWPDEPQLVFAPATGAIIAVDGCSVGTSLNSSYLASYFAAQAISNAMASASAVQSSTAGVNAQGVSQASWNGLSASINGVDGASVAASASSVQTATILVLDANGSAVSCAISSVITQDVMVLSADGVTNGQALFQVDFSATAGVDGAAVGQAIGIGEQSAIVNVSGAASTTSVANAGAAIVLSSDGTSESSSIVAGPGLGIFGADGAAGSAVGYATSSVDVQSIGAVSGSAIGHVAGDTFSGATATVSGTSRAHSVVISQLAGVIGKDGRDVAAAVARAPKAIVLAKDARSESNSVAKAGRAGIGTATGRSESQSIARGDATTTITANYPISIDMTTVPPDAWMVLVPLETTTAAVSVYGDDTAVPQEVTTVTVQSDDAVPVPVDTWKAKA